ncbi:hypothetical protein [Halopelagius longus]|nr:hypothetical protein [Halopelagius longus]
MKKGSSADPFKETEQGGTDQATETNEVQFDQSQTDTERRYPYLLRRKTAKDERTMVQFFLQEETTRRGSQSKVEVEQVLNEEILLTDFREAAFRAGLLHPESIIEILQTWGYDL